MRIFKPLLKKLIFTMLCVGAIAMTLPANACSIAAPTPESTKAWEEELKLHPRFEAQNPKGERIPPPAGLYDAQGQSKSDMPFVQQMFSLDYVHTYELQEGGTCGGDSWKATDELHLYWPTLALRLGLLSILLLPLFLVLRRASRDPHGEKRS